VLKILSDEDVRQDKKLEIWDLSGFNMSMDKLRMVS
jgi:hypothetical protein